MTKVDIRYAFRLCPVRKDDWHLLGFKWLDHYFFDRVLPFSLRSAPFLFNLIADAIHWIISRRADTEDLLHYLDDYFGAGPPHTDKCQQLLNTMVSVCHDLGVPTAPEKIEGPSPIIIFLGIGLDTIKMVMRLPHDKLTDLMQALPTWIQQRSCTKRQLLSLIGTLSFACKCILAGRIFLRRMIVSAQPSNAPMTSSPCQMTSASTSNGGSIFIPLGMAQHPSSIQSGLHPPTLNCSQMPLGQSAVVHTTKVIGSISPGRTTFMLQSNGKRCTQSCWPVQFGGTYGMDGEFYSIAIIHLSGRHLETRVIALSTNNAFGQSYLLRSHQRELSCHACSHKRHR
ncbi:uncharacterized protein [Ptychodera flava]|uniref:uncharacterized protein n=1 Tax=Ptychodera flava TaxID=63121 RepID=UPI003969CAFB